MRTCADTSFHTDRLGTRAIDLLHVACALLLESDMFLTFDARQSEPARSESLDVAPKDARGGLPRAMK